MGYRILSGFSAASFSSLANSYFQRLSSRTTAASVAKLSSSSFAARSASSSSLFRPNIVNKTYVQNLSQEASTNRSYAQVATQTSTMLKGLDTIASQISSEVSNLQSYARQLGNKLLTTNEKTALKNQVESSLNTIKGLTQTSFQGRNLETGLSGFVVRLGSDREVLTINVDKLNSTKLQIDDVLANIGKYTSEPTGAKSLEGIADGIASATNTTASQISAYRSGLDAAARVSTNLAQVAQNAVDTALKG